jgi:hypothetical protein
MKAAIGARCNAPIRVYTIAPNPQNGKRGSVGVKENEEKTDKKEAETLRKRQANTTKG